MNILFVGPYRQNDGWGLATKSYIKALATSYDNITIRPVYLGLPEKNELDSDLLRLENNLYNNYDVVIQKTLPHCLFYDGRYKKNIGLFVLETNNLENSNAISNINRMDEIWVPSQQEAKCLKKSGVIVPIKVISQPIDTESILKYSDYKLQFNSVIDRTFKFYFIGEYTERKNLHDLIVAFHLAFDTNTPVSLIIKSSISGKSPAESTRIIEKECETIKKQLTISNRYKKEIIITERLSDKDLCGLHNACDCFVAPSYGEAFCRPAAEALCSGKTPIVTDNTGMNDYINSNNGYITQSHRVPVLMKQRPLSQDFDIYNAREYWYRIDIYDLINNMRKVYDTYKNDRKVLESKRQIGKNLIQDFSYSSIGTKLCI